ncbi:MAG: hypothetical protein LUM44_22825 [Pyrinomonadaceae bacterium]|nr:hypothetical protein [Pyrinomonadaceae bacterium]
MTVTVFIFLIALVFIIYQILAIVLNVREIRRLRDIRYQTKTQHSFGVARQNLLLLVANKKISDDSITFLFFYLLNTNIMRYPDRYKELSRMLREALLTDKPNSTGSGISDLLKKESEDWDEEVKNIITQNIDSMTFLMVSHSPVLRMVWVLAKLSHKVWLKDKYHGVMSKVAKLISRNDKSLVTFAEARDELSSLTGVV